MVLFIPEKDTHTHTHTLQRVMLGFSNKQREMHVSATVRGDGGWSGVLALSSALQWGAGGAGGAGGDGGGG